MSDERQKVITFKVPETLEEAMKGIPNRSEFIRNAILSALDQLCPLCRGTGILAPNQQRHWAQFARDHSVEQCGRCKAVHLVCKCGSENDLHS
ncbi:MAG: ribbon-helix-helix domain-containing protein [Desulfomonilaceae bacterium]|nr:ribbon-helix-helix domain-containing protein [Desulfomonilaceae bacterium]